MTRPDILVRDDLDALLDAFYGVALHDDLLGPVFTAGGMDLDRHLPRIAAFWEVVLLCTGDYVGSPIQLHRDLAVYAGLRDIHFARWLQLWDETVDRLHAGPVADRAKAEAAMMAAGMLRAIRGEDQRHPQLPIAPPGETDRDQRPG